MMTPKSTHKPDFQGWLKAAAVVLLFLVVAGFLKDYFLKNLLTGLGPKVIGARMEIDRFSLSLTRQSVSIKGLKLYNPPGFPDEVFLDVPQASVRLNPWGLVTGRLHMSTVVIDLKELVIIKDADKKLNVDALKIAQAEKEPAADKSAPKKKGKAPRFFIEELRLNVERVVMKDFTKGESPVIQVYDFPFKDKVIHDVDTFVELVTVVIVQAMAPTAIKTAGIYAAAAVLGVGFLPAGVLGVIVADDDSELEVRLSVNEAFDLCLDFVAERGTLKKQYRQKGIVQAKIDKYDVRFDVTKNEEGSVIIKVAARKFLLPKPAYANGIVYQLERWRPTAVK